MVGPQPRKKYSTIQRSVWPTIGCRGVLGNLKRRGAQFKAKLAGPDIVKSKKKRSTQPQIVLYYEYYFYSVHLSAGGGRGAAPPCIRTWGVFFDSDTGTSFFAHWIVSTNSFIRSHR